MRFIFYPSHKLTVQLMLYKLALYPDLIMLSFGSKRNLSVPETRETQNSLDFMEFSLGTIRMSSASNTYLCGEHREPVWSLSALELLLLLFLGPLCEKREQHHCF